MPYRGLDAHPQSKPQAVAKIRLHVIVLPQPNSTARLAPVCTPDVGPVQRDASLSLRLDRGYGTSRFILLRAFINCSNAYVAAQQQKNVTPCVHTSRITHCQVHALHKSLAFKPVSYRADKCKFHTRKASLSACPLPRTLLHAPGGRKEAFGTAQMAFALCGPSKTRAHKLECALEPKLVYSTSVSEAT
jgi:hypothetical protein